MLSVTGHCPLLAAAGAASDDDSDIVTRRGLVLYDFAAEEEDEVAVVRGESLEVAYEVGGWLQVGAVVGRLVKSFPVLSLSFCYSFDPFCGGWLAAGAMAWCPTAAWHCCCRCHLDVINTVTKTATETSVRHL